MPILPALQPVYDAMAAAPPDVAGVSVAEARAKLHELIEHGYNALMPEHPPVASEVDHRVAVDGGEITVRVYRPETDTTLPCHVYFHGGGFWLGTLEHSDSLCRAVATDAECAVASVDYRLAPEHPFPAPVEDCYTAYLWVLGRADELGIDRARVSVGGGSAGGNLAAVVSLVARDRGEPLPVLQVLEIPVTDFSRVHEETIVGHYLPDRRETSNPYASPLLAPDLSGLPPALVMTAEYDSLCEQGMDFADRLRQAGGEVEVTCWEGQFHGSQMMATLIPEEAAAYQRQLVAALRRAYGTD